MRDDIQALLDRIATGMYTDADLADLRRALLASGHGNGVQIGKYNVQIGAGQNVHIGDVIYQGPEAAAICSALHEVLAQLSLDSTSDRSMQAQLTHIVENLDGLLSLWKSAYAEWQQRVASIQAQQIRNAIFDFSDHVVDRTSGFVGRTFIFDQVGELVSHNRRGYIRIKGKPGIGKSALAAQLVKQEGYCHHFNIAAMHLNDASAFRRSVTAQLIARYSLDESLWSDNSDQASLSRILKQAAQSASMERQKVVVVVDALDEAESDFRANTLDLPKSLPDGVFFVTTERENDPGSRIEVDPMQWSTAINITPSSKQNMDDIEAFLYQSLSRPGIRIYLDRHRTSESEFVKALKDKSEGFFIYLRYMIVDIEQGAYDDNSPYHLPNGLKKYYESHWKRMRGEYTRSEWEQYSLPIIFAIARNPYPVTLDMILANAGSADPNETRIERMKKRATVQDVLAQWGAFLWKHTIQGDTGPAVGYSFYHESFREFLRERTGMNFEESMIYDQVGQNLADDLTRKIWGED